jgi:hypothetical protein
VPRSGPAATARHESLKSRGEGEPDEGDSSEQDGGDLSEQAEGDDEGGDSGAILDCDELALRRPGTAVVLESEIPPLEKIGVARDMLVAVNKAQEDVTVPDVSDAIDHEDESAYRELASELQKQLNRAVTNAFSRSFLAAAALGLLALVPILVGRRDVTV